MVVRKPKERRKDVTKDISIHLRVTEEQKRTLSEAAETLGIGLSAFLLSTALKEAKRLRSEHS